MEARLSLLDAEAAQLAAKIEAAFAKREDATTPDDKALYEKNYDNLVAKEKQLDSRREALERQLGAGVASSSAQSALPHQIMIYYNRSVLKAVNVHTFEQLCDQIQKKWVNLLTSKYEIGYASSAKAVMSMTIDSTTWEAFKNKRKPATFRLRITCSAQGFSTFKDSGDVLQHQLLIGTGVNGIDGNDTAAFPTLELNAGLESVFEELKRSTLASLLVWHKLMPNLDLVQEAGRRGYINLILAAAMTLASAVHTDGGTMKLIPELRIAGYLGAGPVDYVGLYRLIMILVCEAKQLMADGYGQVLVQMAAARESFAVRLEQAAGKVVTSSKRRHWEVDFMDRLSSAAILTNGESWLLLKYIPGKGGKKPTLVSGAFDISYKVDEESLLGVVGDMILRVAALFSAQMAEVDQAILQCHNVELACEGNVILGLIATSQALAEMPSTVADDGEGEEEEEV